ncbi:MULTISPECIES: ADP-ribosylglycohydrolase family protein [Rhodomicrobium]|uniref:ADP-ribosylglycohydrolase family protein n=1 Tax=Rhodomicrobium TaxID=1068 RepID=UPI001481E60C|nr:MULTISPECIES: ADP-ribosylglycohydrolase family protein [Rhodomicrobium]
MWLAQSIANWTGLITEGDRTDKPFYTDEDWGGLSDFHRRIGFVFQDPWRADDDTDVEYILLHLMNEYHTTLLSPQQLADGWDTYFRREDFVWISNLTSLRLIRRGALPPATGMGAVNAANDPKEEMSYLMIDAQLTTEMCGALAPGMPVYALRICDLPIRNTAASYAAHAAQEFVLLYALAPVADPALSDRDKVIWLATEARKYIPDTSKTADIFDFVLGEFRRMCPAQDAPGCDDWEDTRDRIAERYQLQADGNGFKYYDWYDSAVNYATGMMALLYGQGDLKRTIRIGTLSGWDSDNGTATMGGVLGLMNGYDWVAAQFPGRALSDRYSIRRTRSHELPDYLPRDRAAEDSFTMMAARMRPLVVEALGNGGGGVDGGTYRLPALPASNQVELTPTTKLYRSSANNRLRLAGGIVTASSSADPSEERAGPGVFADGVEEDFSGREPSAPSDEFWGMGDDVTFTVSYSEDVPMKILRFIEGGAHANAVGWFRTVRPQMLVNGAWQDLPAGAAPSAKITAAPYQIIDWTLPETLPVSAIRLRGATAGGFASIIELDALSDMAHPPAPAELAGQ